MRATVYAPIIVLVISLVTSSFAFDIDGDGREGLPEAIHALQVVAGVPGVQGDTTAPPPKTGQTDCYSMTGIITPCPATGQDGEYQKGVPWPTPRFTDFGNGTVKDNLTGLIWLKKANCILTDASLFDTDDTNAYGELPDYDVVGDGKVLFTNAALFIDLLNAGVTITCGDTSNHGTPQTDWRLPNRFELESLFDLSQSEPSLPPAHPFTNVARTRYWSSSYSATFKDLGVGWVVNFNTSTADSKSWSLQAANVWPVRGGID